MPPFGIFSHHMSACCDADSHHISWFSQSAFDGMPCFDAKNALCSTKTHPHICGERSDDHFLFGDEKVSLGRRFDRAFP
jgi:hypothetical protein